MRGRSKNTMNMKSKEEDEVEQLLQATQDHFLLNLSLNSHTTRSSPSLFPSSSSSPSNNYDDISLDLDLERRFQALKGKTPSQNKDQELNSVLGHDLSSRFAALKGKSSSSHDQLGVGPTALCNEYEEESEDEEDQVQKLIEWAKDAARLDPSPPSDEEDDSDEDDSDADEDDRRRKRK